MTALAILLLAALAVAVYLIVRERAGRRALEVAQDLENTLPGVRYDRGPIAVEVRDGIPQDPGDLANEQATLRGAKLISRRRALMGR